MFKLVAFLFLAANPDPVGSMTYNEPPFASEELCTTFMESDEGKAATGLIERAANARSLAVKFACVEAKDNTI